MDTRIRIIVITGRDSATMEAVADGLTHGRRSVLRFPECRLHPSRQIKIAEELCESERSVVVLTHSETIVTAIMTAVAQRVIEAYKVAFLWVTGKPEDPKITTAEVDDTGAYADWPCDLKDTTIWMHQQHALAIVTRGKGVALSPNAEIAARRHQVIELWNEYKMKLAEIAERLGVTVPVIVADIKALRGLGIEIEARRG